MLPEVAKESLTSTMTQSLETMAFVLAEPISGPVDPPINPIAVSIHFKGPKSGRIEIAASREFSLILASSILGTEPNDPEVHEKADDCLKELVNVVGGAMIPGIADSPDQEFKLTLPTIKPVDVDIEWPIIVADTNTVLFNADGHIIAARLIAE